MRQRRKRKIYDPDLVSTKMGFSTGKHSQKIKLVGQMSLIRKSKMFYQQKERIF